MQVTVFPPSPALAPFVDRFAIVETAGEPEARVLLPEPGLMMAVRFAGAARLASEGQMPDAALTGIRRSARHMQTDARSGVVITAFKPGGAAACFREPMHELFGLAVGLDGLIPRPALAALTEQVAAAGDHARRVALVDAFLRARVAPDRTDAMVAAAVIAIRRARGQVRIAELARSLGISQDPLEKRFRRAIGATPKHWASLIRMSQVIGDRGGGDWARRAIAAGYYDQAHFIRDFRAVTGEAPERFFRAGNYC